MNGNRLNNKMKKQKDIHPLVFIVAMLFTPLILIFASNLLIATQQLYEAPDWVINIARPINVVIALLCIVYSFIVERNILKSHEKIKKGDGTKVIALLCGVAFSVAPAFLAFCFFMVGSPVVNVQIYSALYFEAILFWAWRYRRLLIPTPVDAGHKPITDNTLLIPKSSSVNTNTLVRPYTVILGILGLLSFLLLASTIMWFIHPPKDYYLGQKEMSILIIPFYLLFLLSLFIRLKK